MKLNQLLTYNLHFQFIVLYFFIVLIYFVFLQNHLAQLHRNKSIKSVFQYFLLQWIKFMEHTDFFLILQFINKMFKPKKYAQKIKTETILSLK